MNKKAVLLGILTVMARRLRVNLRTYQNWEQDASKPNAQAAVLLKLIENNPEIFDQLAAIS